MKMKWYSAAVLFLLLAVAFSEDGYPTDIDIGLQVVVYFSDNEGNVFCTGVLISFNRVLATNNCFSEKNIRKENYYALVGSKECESRTRFKILDSFHVPPFEVLILDGEMLLNSESYKAGLPIDREVKINRSTKMKIYGYIKYGVLPSDKGLPASTDVTLEPSIYPFIYYSFTIQYIPYHVYHVPNWQSSPVFAGRFLVAICDRPSKYLSIVCRKLSIDMQEKLKLCLAPRKPSGPIGN